MKKYWIPIIAVLAVAVIGVAVWLIFFHNTVPPFSQNAKEKVKQAYFEEWMNSNENLYQIRPIIWYDENGCTEENLVWRYVGTYGKCYAFLKIGDNKNDYCSIEEKLPYRIDGLSRVVYYPIEANVVVYHTGQPFTEQEVYGGGESAVEVCSLAYLWQIDNREDWITDAQLEQLTADVEKMAREHS